MGNEKIYLKIKYSCETIFRNKYSIYDHDTIYDSILSLIVQYRKNSAPIINFDCWISGAIHNHFCSYLSKKKKAFLFSNEGLEKIADLNINEQLEPQKYYNNIAKLKHPFKEIIELRLFASKSFKEISNLLKIKEVTVRKYYSRGLEKLRTNFSNKRS